MHATALILACLLPAQAPPAESRPAESPLAESPLAESPLAESPLAEERQPMLFDGASSAEEPALSGQPIPQPPVRPESPPKQPPELVAELLVLPQGTLLTGRPLSLLDILSSGQDRSRQAEQTHAYWRLTRALAEYRCRFDRHAQLQQIADRPPDALAMTAARASAAAELGQARLAALAAQHDLARAATLPEGDPLPLCRDAPHVGSYRTYFDEITTSRSLPSQTRLIHRTLPIRWRAIELRAQAVETAEHALEAAAHAYRLADADLASLLACTREVVRQRCALIQSVCDYNHDVADYALAVAGPEADGQALAAMLITPKEELSPMPLSPPEPSGVQPATLDEPVESTAGDAEKRTGAGEPVLPQPSMVPVPQRRLQPTARTANKPVLDDPMPVVPGLYPALVDAEPADRARQLAAVLHWDGSLPEPAGRPIELKECLREASGADRLALIDAYWLARQRAAEYQALLGQRNFLEELIALAEARGVAPFPAGETARLRTARLAADADLSGAHAKLLESQFDLTRRAGRPLDSAWLLPATTPHSGNYALKLDAQPPELVQSWPVRRLVATIPGLVDGLHDRATAVVRADSARAAATAAYHAGSLPVDRVLGSIQRQTTETLAFLATLTAYNRALADYVLTVLPSSLSGDQLADALVVTR